jgi:hypothetical protein
MLSRLHTIILIFCCTIGNIAFAAQPDIANGDVLNPDVLESKGIYMYDGFLATALVFGAMGIDKIKSNEDAGRNLMGEHFSLNGGAEIYKSSPKLDLDKKRVICAKKAETFARLDCIKNLVTDFTNYGDAAFKAKFLRVHYQGLIDWDSKSETLLMRNSQKRTFGNFSVCMKNAICTTIGAADRPLVFNMICMHLPPNYTDHIQAGRIPEALARQVSAKHGNIMNLKSSMIFEVVKPLKVFPQYKQCNEPGFEQQRLWAEGWIAPKAMLFGDPANASFVATEIKFLPP